MMKFFTHQNRKRRSKRKHVIEIDPRRYWVIILSFLVLGVAIELVYFSLMFLKVSKNIDAPATPTLQTNSSKIKAIERELERIEKALEERTGKIPVTQIQEKSLE